MDTKKVIEELDEIQDSEMFDSLTQPKQDQKTDKDLYDDSVNDNMTSKDEEVKVARPTTKPTDVRQKFGQRKPSYNYFAQQDKEILASFPQTQDPTIIQPKKLVDPELIKKIEEPDLKKKNSAWNKAGTW